MIDRAGIELLLNATGRTLEGLPEEYPIEKVDKIACMTDWEHANHILHQSDVIELLVDALVDATEANRQTEELKKKLDAAMGCIPKKCGTCKYWIMPPEIRRKNGRIYAVYCKMDCQRYGGGELSCWEWNGLPKERTWEDVNDGKTD